MPFQYGGIVRHDSLAVRYVSTQGCTENGGLQVSSLCSQGNDHLERLHQGEPHQRIGDSGQKGPPEDAR